MTAVELEPEGRAMASARDSLRKARAACRTAALASISAGMSESEAARRYGVTRMTIRAWRQLS